MFYVGTPSVKAQRLTEITHECLMRGIEVARPGNTLGDIGHAIQSFADLSDFLWYEILLAMVWARHFIAAPTILHYGLPGEGMRLEPGMIFTIEPMINAGRYETKILSDGWTAVTRDKSLSAQFEHSIGVTDDAPEIFTLSTSGLTMPPYNT